MKIINLEQGSAEWHIYRQTHIGSSDAPAIMGVSPYKTRWELWAEKVGLREGQTQTGSMKRGNMLEPKVKDMINEEYGCNYCPSVIESSEFEFLSYSSDGYDNILSRMIEIKCGSKEEHKKVKLGKVPEKYYPQLQHALLVTGLNSIIYVSYFDNEHVLTIVKRNDEYIKTMLAELQEFHRCVQMLEEPKIDEFHKKHSKPQYMKRDDDLWHSYASQWKAIQERKKQLENEEKELKNEMIYLSNENNSEGFGVKLLRVDQKGTIDYSLIPELKNVDLEQYRKPGKSFWRIDCER